MADEKVVLDGEDMRRTLVRIAHEIVEKNGDAEGLAVVGIHRRGAILARRVHALLADLVEGEVPLGDLDISFYRDDLGRRTEAPVVHASHVDFPLDGAAVVIVDDVLFTGRTARAAIEALFDYGRPARVQLAVLADRGHRELPIRPDYVGKNLPTALAERVNVHVAELDGTDEVTISTLREAGRSPAVHRRPEADGSHRSGPARPDAPRRPAQPAVHERPEADRRSQDAGLDAPRRPAQPAVHGRPEADRRSQDAGLDAPRR